MKRPRKRLADYYKHARKVARDASKPYAVRLRAEGRASAYWVMLSRKERP